MRPLILLTFSVLCVVTTYAARQIDPPTLSDQYGNTADENSVINFLNLGDVDIGEAYVVNPEEYTYNGLKPLFDGMHGFVNICFGKEDPFDMFLGLLTGSTAFGTDLILSLAKWGYGYALCLLIGLIFVFIFPIVGCCFCCCRTCCGNCGGKMVQKRDGKTDTWRACYIITLFVSCTFLGMTTTLSKVSSTVTENVEDFARYANNTIEEINYVALNGFDFTARVMLRDLQNIGPIVGGDVQRSFDESANIGEAFDRLLAMDPLLKSLIDGLTDVGNSKTAVGTSITTLDNSMAAVATDIDNTFGTCGSSCGTPPDTSDLSSGAAFDPNTMPDFSTELNDLETVYASNITALVLEGKIEFDNISGIVEDEAQSVVASITDMVNSFDTVVSDALSSVDDMMSLFDTITNLTEPISNLDTMAISGDLTLGDLDRYRWMGGLGLTCFVLLILVLQLLGVILGCCACCCCGDKKTLPTERGGVGNCAGILLMSSVGLVFIFGALIMLLVWITYIIGAPLEQLLCVNLRDPEYTIFKNLIDGGDPTTGPHSTMLGEQEGYTMGQMVFQDPSVPLTVSGLLSDCDANAPAWTALYIDRFFDIDAVMDYKSTIDVTTEIDKLSVDLSTLVILSPETKTQLTDMSVAISSIDFDGLVSSLEVETVTADFSALTSSLQATADAINGQASLSGVHANLLNHITELNRIETEDFANVDTAKKGMLADVRTLNATSATVPNQVSELITTVDGTQTTLQADGEEIVKNSSKLFASRVLGIADQFVAYVNSTIREELGRCKPVSNFYQSVLVNTLCGSLMDSWNGVWFTLGWCVAFMFLGVILSTKLAKHVRRMKELHPEDQGNSENYGAGPGNGKVHPI